MLDGDEISRIFAWMRPNDLVWNYWVNNYLMGNPPPAFDVLYWSNNSTRLPAVFHAEILDMFADNRLVKPGAMKVRGTPIDLSKVTFDKMFIAGTTDHITPWKGALQFRARLRRDDRLRPVQQRPHPELDQPTD